MKLFPFNLLRIVRNRDRAAVRATYDAAQTTIDNREHWAAADSLSPDASASADTRRTLRNRARYEVRNNSFARGIVTTIANDTVGRGPRLRMLTKDQKDLETAWKIWCRETRFASKLRTMRMAKVVDGEAIARLVTNRRLSTVQLDLRLYESDSLADPTFGYWRVEASNQEIVDGIELDAQGNPVQYHLFKVHPGGTNSGMLGIEGEWVRRANVLHLYREDRPGQHRGIPELAPALPLFAMLRRYSLSTLAAAETAADLAAVLKTDASNYTLDDVQGVDPGVSFPIRRRTIMSLPMGWEVQQLRAEQPTTTYREFRDAILNEICRCLNVPFNVAAGNSADYNYASGRLDHQMYFRAIDVEREDMIDNCVETVFERWLREYLALSSGIAPSDVNLELYPHRWFWDPHPHVDPMKEASAVQMLWDKGLVTDDDYLMSQGIDPEEHYEKLKAMIEERKPLGLPLPGLAMQSIVTNEVGGKGQPSGYDTEGMGEAVDGKEDDAEEDSDAATETEAE